jgi:hypothetical protein
MQPQKCHTTSSVSGEIVRADCYVSACIYMEVTLVVHLYTAQEQVSLMLHVYSFVNSSGDMQYL